ncbi:MAG: hypothetical protein WBD40_23140 [Tepidisphaeraceae bacterium]
MTSPAPSKATAPKAAAGQPKASAAYPKGAQWTILCREVHGPNHVERARQFKEAAMKTPGMRDWHLLHKESQSQIYYGYYRTHDDPRAKADRKVIDAMTDAQGNRPFRLALIQPLSSADVGPPEWNLVNAKGFYTLQIAVYRDSPERKQYAVDAVKGARAQGIEAYYYHGESMSLVCVGTWPSEAVQLADEMGTGGERGETKVVLPPLPPEVKAPILKDKDGRRLHVEAPSNEVLDPTLKAMMQQYPTNAINGETMLTTTKDPRSGRAMTVPDPSVVVPIPRGEESMLDGDTAGGAAPIPPPDEPMIDTNRRATPGGRLKTVGS